MVQNIFFFCRCNGERFNSGHLRDVENNLENLSARVTIIDKPCYNSDREKQPGEGGEELK